MPQEHCPALDAHVVVAVSFAVDTGRSGLICALFHDVEDGADFGTTLAAQFLAAFVDAYPDLDVRSIVDVNAYTGFGARIPDVVRGALRCGSRPPSPRPSTSAR